ncbi:aldo/keto reductase [Helicobacter sp. T3_23-1059]
MKINQTKSLANSRREFIKTSASLALGLALPPLAFCNMAYAKKSAQSDLKNTLKSTLQTTTLNNAIKIPLVGFGTSRMGGSECQKAVENALEVGYRLIDTAQMYGNELEVGNAIKTALKGGNIKRNELFITTKLSSDMSYDETIKSTLASLKKLQIDYVDLLLLHKNYPQSLAMYRAMEKLHKDGKIKSLGISNFDVQNYENFIKKCEITPVINQMETHIFYQQKPLREAMKGYGTKLEAWSPFANGKNDFFANPTLAEISKKHSKTPAQIALRFLVEQDIIVIPKTSKIERMKENIAIFDFALDDADREALNALDTNEPLFKWF